jgi:cytochrome c oxidase subunit II
VCLCTYAYLVLHDVEKANANPLQVRVVGQQFEWTFYYPSGSGKEVSSPELYLPVNRQVQFTLQSRDVIHDFWVPAFRIKKDAVPGIDTKYVIKPTLVGSYAIVCAELCGLGHSTMRGTAHVMSQRNYNAWFAKLKSGKKVPAGSGTSAPPTPSGKALFTSSACGACHKLADAGSSGNVGPDLDKGLAGKSPAYIKQSIVDPNAVIAPGYQAGIMPQNFSQQLTPAEIDALVKYLSDVTKGG